MLCEVSQPICKCMRLVVASFLICYCIHGNDMTLLSCSFFDQRKMEQTLQIAINSKGKGHSDSSSRNEQGNLGVKSDIPSSLILLREREKNNNQNDFIDMIFF